MTLEPNGAPGIDDAWEPVATHGMSEEEVVAALDRAAAVMLAESLAEMRAEGWPEAAVAIAALLARAITTAHNRREAPGIMRRMAQSAGVELH